MRLFARMGARRDPDRPARRAGRRAARGRGHRRAAGGASNLRLPATPTRGAPSRTSRSASAWLWARQRAKRSSSARATCGQPRPAPERALRHAAVDQDERDAAPIELHDGVRPDLGFGDERDVRLPVVEEAADIARHVERHELVHGAGRQAAGDELGRSPRPRGDEDMQPALGQALDHRQERRASRRCSPRAARRGRRAGAAGSGCRAARRGAPGPPCRLRMRQQKDAAATGSSATRPPR